MELELLQRYSTINAIERNGDSQICLFPHSPILLCYITYHYCRRQQLKEMAEHVKQKRKRLQEALVATG